MKPVDELHDLRVLSLWEPWASWVAKGLKTYETRTWACRWRGPLLIHASLRVDGDARHAYADEEYSMLPDSLGKVLALVELTDCHPIGGDEEAGYEPSPKMLAAAMLDRLPQLLVADRAAGITRYAFKLEHLRPLEPFALKGAQGLRRATPDVVERVRSQLEVRGG